MDIRTVFMGSPEFSLPVLRRLAEIVRLVGVITQPDRPAGRGQVLTSPPVKRVADELNVEVIQPNRLRQPEAMARLQTWAPDVIVVAAFGQILRPVVLDLPRYGCINVHASLLPRWRGAAPIQAAILHGDDQTGVTIMKMDPGVDTGPTLARRVTEILPADTAGSLSDRLAVMGADLLAEILPDYLAGRLLPTPQPAEGACYAGLIRKEDAALDFTQPAAVLARKVMAFNPWPGAYTTLQGQNFKIHRAHAAGASTAAPGQRGVIDALPAIATAEGWLVLDEVQPAGKKPMPGGQFLRGARDWSS